MHINLDGVYRCHDRLCASQVGSYYSFENLILINKGWKRKECPLAFVFPVVYRKELGKSNKVFSNLSQRRVKAL